MVDKISAILQGGIIVKAGRAILDLLKQHNVNDVFGLPGETTLDLYRNWCNRDDVSYHLCRDERNSVFMAGAYSKASGKVGVCEGPSVGAPHMIPGIAEAFYSNTPVICITSDVPLKYATRNMLTSCDQTALFKSVTKETLTIHNAQDIPHIFRRAFRSASSGITGPVHIRIPSDILSGEVSDSDVYSNINSGMFPEFRFSPSDDMIQKAVSLIAKSERPAMVCGQGSTLSGAWNEIRSLVIMQSIAVGTTINAKGVVSDSLEMSLGVIGARGGQKWSNDMINDADLVIFCGSSTDSASTNDWTIPNPKSQQIFIEINSSEKELGNNYNSFPLHGDVQETLKKIIDALACVKLPDRSTWQNMLMIEKKHHEETINFILKKHNNETHPLAVMKSIEKLAPGNTYYAVDPGTPAIYSSCFLNLAKEGRRTAYNFSMGALGYAIPAAIGAKIALGKNVPVVGLVSDGSFGFCAGELETAVRLGTNITYILFNNNTFGWIRATEYAHCKETLTNNFDKFTNFSNIDYVKFAESFGLKGYRANNMPEFDSIFTKCIESDTSSLIEITVMPEDKDMPPVPDWAEMAKKGYNSY